MQIETGLEPGEASKKTTAMLTSECEFLKSFQHANVVEHLSTDRHPRSHSPILVMELMDCNLKSYLSGLGETSLTSLCQISLSKDVASGLAYIHSMDVIHRDMCGDNILLKLDKLVPVAKISDFGMSRLLDPFQMSRTLTVIGHRMGYMPPEAASTLGHQLYDYSLDVFSLGVIMVQIVCQCETVETAKDRKTFFSQIPTKHKLKHIISECLQDKMNKRPHAKHICKSIIAALCQLALVFNLINLLSVLLSY